MKFLSDFLFITVIVLFAHVDSIRDGEFISIEEAPFFATLVNEEDSDFYAYCGASIISEHWLLTAAHCIDFGELGSKFIYCGGSNFINLTRNIHSVEKSFVHADWNHDNNDIALIKLKHPIQFNEYQQPIRLRHDRVENGSIVTLYGIGNQGNARDGAPVLKKTEVQYVNQSFCRSVYGAYYIPDSVFCASSNDTDGCGGDSGGPAVIDGKLAGITSTGAHCITINRDANDDPLAPGTYTQTDYFYDWILKITGLQL